MGRDWLLHLRLGWKQIHSLKHTISVEKFLESHEAVFKEGLETLKTFKAKIYVDPDVRPIYCKARSVPYSLRVKVEEELDRLVQEGVLEPVQFAEWAAPIVPVVKPDKSVRVCGDFKLTVNKASQLDSYPIPKAEDLFATLAGGISAD